MPKISDGPFVQVACMCEQVIQDTEGGVSLIRVIDTLTHTSAGPNPPRDLPPFSFQMKLAVMLKAGAASGRHEIRIVPELPNGTTGPTVTVSIYFEGDEKGANIFAPLNFPFTLEGLYWFEVFLEDTKLTSIPLRVKYNRVVTGTTTPAPPQS